MLLHQIPSALAIVGLTVVGTVASAARLPLDAQAVEIALIGGGAVVVAQVVIAIAAARQAKLARGEASLAREASDKAAEIAKKNGKQIDIIAVQVDGQLTAYRQEVANLRDELARIYPDNIHVQRQAAEAKKDVETRAEVAKRARLEGTGSRPSVKP